MMTDAERQMILQNALMMETSQQNRVAWVGMFEAHVWRMPPKINHWLHGILSLLTWGLWLIVWLIVMATEAKPVLVGIAVDPYGQLYEFDPKALANQDRPNIH